MAVYSVTYDLLNPGKDYARLTSRIEQYDSIKGQYSQWFVSADKSAIELRDDLKGYCDPNDKLAVAQVFKGCWAFWNMIPIGNWLQARGL